MMVVDKSDIDVLKLYEESGIDESYGENPYNFFSSNTAIFVKEPENTFKNTSVNVSILKAKQEAEKILQKVSCLKDLQKAVAEFSLSPLSKFASHSLYGVGVENPDLLVITEMPNADEDRSGVMLSGATGEMLKKILVAINSSVEKNTYVFPASSFRAPGARMPTQEEMEISIPFIEKFIEILKPKIILTMGSLPTNILLKSSKSITMLRGKWAEYNNISVMPTFALTYLLNNVDAKRKAWADLKMLAEKL